MATNLQIYALRTNEALLQRIEVAIARYATYIRTNQAATEEQRQWAYRVFEGGQSAAIAQACAWEVVNDPLVRDAADVAGLPDTGGGSLQVAVEAVALKYGGTFPTTVQR